MSLFSIIALGGVAAFVAFALANATGRRTGGGWAGAALLCLAFLGYSLIPVLREGPLGFVDKHLQDWWGIQIWLDLLIAFGIGWLFFVPRARAAGMNPLPWLIAILLGGSIGFLAAIARLLWLEGRNSRPAG